MGESVWDQNITVIGHLLSTAKWVSRAKNCANRTTSTVICWFYMYKPGKNTCYSIHLLWTNKTFLGSGRQIRLRRPISKHRNKKKRGFVVLVKTLKQIIKHICLDFLCIVFGDACHVNTSKVIDYLSFNTRLSYKNRSGGLPRGLAANPSRHQRTGSARRRSLYTSFYRKASTQYIYMAAQY